MKKNAGIFLYSYISSNTGISKSSVKLKVNQHNPEGRKNMHDSVVDLTATES